MTILNNGRFSGLEILEIHRQIYWLTYQHTPNTVTETLNTEKPETLNQNQTRNDNNRNTANTTQTLTQEEKNECRNHEKNHDKVYCLLSGTKTGGQSNPKPRK